MCISGSPPSPPKPVPPPKVADFFKQRGQRNAPPAGFNPSIATSPLGLTSQPNIAQKTLLGR